MPLLNSELNLIDNRYQRLDAEQPIPESGNYFVPVSRWSEEQLATDLQPRLAPEIDPETAEFSALEPFLATASLIAIHFDSFRDGRGFSFARMIRRTGYQGELRATGDVTLDRIAFLKRCGFDSFEVDEAITADSAKAAQSVVSVVYQSSADQQPPVYLR